VLPRAAAGARPQAALYEQARHNGAELLSRRVLLVLLSLNPSLQPPQRELLEVRPSAAAATPEQLPVCPVRTLRARAAHFGARGARGAAPDARGTRLGRGVVFRGFPCVRRAQAMLRSSLEGALAAQKLDAAVVRGIVVLASPSQARRRWRARARRRHIRAKPPRDSASYAVRGQ
jgi:hypothetical protein